VPVELIGDLWIGMSGNLLITSWSVGSLDELPLLELRDTGGPVPHASCIKSADGTSV